MVATLCASWRSMCCLFRLVLRLFWIRVFHHILSVGFIGFIISLHHTSISRLPFTVLLLSHWYVHHVRSHSTDCMAKTDKEGEHSYAFRALYKLCQLYSTWHILVVARGSELCCRLSCARRALSKSDKVIKMGVLGVILYLTLRRPARLLWTDVDSRVKALRSPGSLCSGSRHDKSFIGMASLSRAHTFTNTCTHKVIMWHPPRGTCDTC